MKLTECANGISSRAKHALTSSPDVLQLCQFTIMLEALDKLIGLYVLLLNYQIATNNLLAIIFFNQYYMDRGDLCYMIFISFHQVKVKDFKIFYCRVLILGNM